jgi:hypothetical protein
MAGGKFPKDVELLFKKLYKNKDIKTVKPGSRSMRLGFPVMFVYDAKHKNTLPYWDSLPFSIVLAKYPDGFLGLNLHYLEWTKRLQLGKLLVRRSKNKNRITYKDIKSAWKALKLPEALLYLVIRRYLYSHIASDMKAFDWETYSDALKDIRPKFKKESEKRVLAAIRAKWNLHRKKTNARKKGK